MIWMLFLKYIFLIGYFKYKASFMYEEVGILIFANVGVYTAVRNTNVIANIVLQQ